MSAAPHEFPAAPDFLKDWRAQIFKLAQKNGWEFEELQGEVALTIVEDAHFFRADLASPATFILRRAEFRMRRKFNGADALHCRRSGAHEDLDNLQIFDPARRAEEVEERVARELKLEVAKATLGGLTGKHRRLAWLFLDGEVDFVRLAAAGGVGKRRAEQILDEAAAQLEAEAGAGRQGDLFWEEAA